MNNELISHLRDVDNNSLIGICIQRFVKKEEELQEMLDDLRTINREFPDIMKQIIGKEASWALDAIE